MLEHSFIFLDRITKKSEQAIWAQGITNWDQFLEAKEIKGISKTRKSFYDKHIKRAKEEKKNKNTEFFNTFFQQKERWRLFEEFKHECCYLDIETSGSTKDITVLSIYDEEQMVTFVKGKNLDKQALLFILNNYKMIVTFNGASFDIPALEKYLGIQFHQLHFDLRYPLQQLGYTGGLKSIERQLDIRRESDGMKGIDAVHQWRQYFAGNHEQFLMNIIQYNQDDVHSLPFLADYGVKKLSQHYFELLTTSKINSTTSKE